ncbi:MAG: DUF3568 family protein [Syntrophales bacterium]|jgi:hypothetical protein
MMSSKTAKGIILLLITMILLITACDTALIIGSHTVGIQSGRFIYSDGYLKTQYHAPVDRIWDACEKTLTDLKAVNIERQRKIAGGSFNAVIQDDKVIINIEYVAKSDTDVSILVGMGGNNLASQLIHERITKELMKP